MSESKRINLESPRYDQSTFEGRAKHFFITTNPMNVLASDADLENAKTVVEAYRSGKEDKTLTEDQIWAAKELYDSAFHCQTGEKLFLPGSHCKSFSKSKNIAQIVLLSFLTFNIYRTDVIPGPWKHVHHWVHDDLLQKHSRGDFLAACKSVI